ncbi:MAG TPA: hypothetical protein VHT05_10590 [Candidatus Elarobacter sp.]|nr:hypothetical protein [Candidatus Elarobacter sp.]
MATTTHSSRAAASAVTVLALLLPACGGGKAPAPPAAVAAIAPAAAAAAPAGPAGPANALASQAGRAGAVALDPLQRRALEAAVTHAPAAERKNLRYALATDDHGTPHLVVYDGGGLGPDGRDPRNPHQYVVFLVVNVPGGVHYDPQQNSIVDPIPPPVQRDATLSAR